MRIFSTAEENPIPFSNERDTTAIGYGSPQLSSIAGDYRLEIIPMVM